MISDAGCHYCLATSDSKARHLLSHHLVLSSLSLSSPPHMATMGFIPQATMYHWMEDLEADHWMMCRVLLLENSKHFWSGVLVTFLNPSAVAYVVAALAVDNNQAVLHGNIWMEQCMEGDSHTLSSTLMMHPLGPVCLGASWQPIGWIVAFNWKYLVHSEVYL